jgi:hypothetical protein
MSGVLGRRNEKLRAGIPLDYFKQSAFVRAELIDPMRTRGTVCICDLGEHVAHNFGNERVGESRD